MTTADPNPAFRVAFDRRGDTVVATPSGELDVYTAPLLAEQMRAQECERLVLDLRSLGFMDSSGLRMLVAERDRAGSAGHELAIVTGSPEVDRLLQLTRMNQQLPIVEASAAGL